MDMRRIGRWLSTNQGVAVVMSVLLCVYLIYLELTPWVHRELRDGFTLGFFPVAGVVAMLVCSAAMIFDRFRREEQEGLSALRLWSTLAMAIVFVGSYVFFVLMVPVGFLIVSPIFLLAMMLAMGMRPIRTAVIVTVVTTAVVYGIFWALGIPLPDGVLPF